MTTKIKTKSELVKVEPSNGNALALTYDTMPIKVFSKAQFEILTQKVPPHAMKQRDDGYYYVASGWIKHVLFQALGLDWDWEMLPIESGAMYSHRQRTEGNKPVDYIATTGRLTVRIRDPKSLNVVTTITKTGNGSQVWRAKMELGDAIKGSDTDALRNAAFKLGIASDYKWSDEDERKKYDDAQAILNNATKASEPITEPGTVAELIQFAGMSLDELLKIAEVKDFAELSSNLKAAIEKVKAWKAK